MIFQGANSAVTCHDELYCSSPCQILGDLLTCTETSITRQFALQIMPAIVRVDGLILISAIGGGAIYPKFVTSKITQHKTPLQNIIGGTPRTCLRSDFHVATGFFLLELALCALSSCYAKRSTVLCLLSKYVLELQRKQSLVHVHTNNNVLTQETTEWAPCQVDQIGAKAGLLTLENTGQSQQNVTQHGYSYMKASLAPLLIWFNTISRSMITILFFSEMVDYANAAMVR